MNKAEFETFVGIFRKFRCFELLYKISDEDDLMDIFNLYKTEPFTGAVEDLTTSIIRYMETQPEFETEYDRRIN